MSGIASEPPEKISRQQQPFEDVEGGDAAEAAFEIYNRQAQKRDEAQTYRPKGGNKEETDPDCDDSHLVS